MTILQAHRGVSTEYPENTMPAFLAAAEQGYGAIELDVGVTKDGVFVLIHDDTINRTARNRDGSPIEKPLALCDLTYEETLQYDFGIWFHKKFAGTPLPLLKDVLDMAQKAGIQLKIDNKYRSMSPEHQQALYKLLEPYEDTAALTSKDLESITMARKHFPNMQLHYGGALDEELLQTLSRIVPREQLTLWLPYNNARTSYVTVPFVSPERAAQAKRYGKLGIWNLCEYEELEEMMALGADVVETNGQVKPVRNQGVLADMHTHSRNSHDASFPVMEICQAEMAAGVTIMAVTDHCDTLQCEDDPNHDIYTNILASCEEAKQTDALVGSGCRVLTGVELGEAFWAPAQSAKVLHQTNYDVVIGAVHAVKCDAVAGRTGMKLNYSQLDFATLAPELMDNLLTRYFEDVMVMLETTDFDILAHLTCPVGYPLRRHGILVEVTKYEPQIRVILETIIRKGIALEVGCGSFLSTGRFHPHQWIIELYRKMGGYLITLSSDAHSPKGAASGFPEAVEFLKKTGFRNIFYYEGRRSYQCTL